MAIANTTFDTTTWGDKKVVYGKSVISGATDTGDVVTGLSSVEMFQITIAGATQKGCSVNETLPLASGDVTVVTETNDQTLYWLAVGY